MTNAVIHAFLCGESETGRYRLFDLHVDHELLESGSYRHKKALLYIEVATKRDSRGCLRRREEEAPVADPNTVALCVLLKHQIQRRYEGEWVVTAAVHVPIEIASRDLSLHSYVIEQPLTW